jgi:hypothetical protein
MLSTKFFAAECPYFNSAYSPGTNSATSKYLFAQKIINFTMEIWVLLTGGKYAGLNVPDIFDCNSSF